MISWQIMFTLRKGSQLPNQTAEGPWKEPAMNLISALGIKNYSFIWTDEYFGVANGTGDSSYNGALGLLQRNEADFFSGPTQISFRFLGVATMGPIISSTEGRIYSGIIVTNYPSDVLNVFKQFSPEVIIQLVLACACFTLLLSDIEIHTKAQPTKGFFTRSLFSLWHFFNLLILNPILNSRSISGKCLLYYYSISFMFFTWYWTNMMSTDMTIYDTSKTLHSWQEVARIKDVAPVFMDMDIYWDLFWEKIGKGNKDLDEVMSRAELIKNVNTKDFQTTGGVESMAHFYKLPQNLIDGKTCLISSDFVLPMIINGYCGIINEVNANIKVYSGKHGFYPTPLATFYGKDISKKHKRDLDTAVNRVLEHGFFLKYQDELADSTLGEIPSPFKPVEGCFTTFDEHMERIGPYSGQAVTSFNMKGAFILWAVGVMAAATALILEIKLHFIKKQLIRMLIEFLIMRVKVTRIAMRVKLSLRRRMRAFNEKRQSRSSEDDMMTGPNLRVSYENDVEGTETIDKDSSRSRVLRPPELSASSVAWN